MEEYEFRYAGVAACALIDIAAPKGKPKSGRIIEVGVHTSGEPSGGFDDIASCLSGVQNAAELVATIETSLGVAIDVAQSALKRDEKEGAIYLRI